MSLMKYLTPPGLDLLVRSRIRVCKFHDTNDDYECLCEIIYPTDVGFWESAFDNCTNTDPFFRDAALLRSNNPSAYNKLRRAYANFAISKKVYAENILPERLRDGLSRAIFFISLTRSFPNETLWERYGGNHTGFIVELDDQHPFFQQYTDPSGQLSRILAVEYVDSPHRVPFGQTGLAVPLLFKKLAEKWQEEDEIRMLFFHEYCHEEDGHHYVSIPRESIAGIIIGSNCPPDVRKSIEEINAKYFGGQLTIREE